MGNNMAFQCELKKKKTFLFAFWREVAFLNCLVSQSSVQGCPVVQVPLFVCVHLAVGKPCLVVHL